MRSGSFSWIAAAMAWARVWKSVDSSRAYARETPVTISSGSPASTPAIASSSSVP